MIFYCILSLFLFVQFICICSVAVRQLFIKDFDWLIDWSHSVGGILTALYGTSELCAKFQIKTSSQSVNLCFHRLFDRNKNRELLSAHHRRLPDQLAQSIKMGCWAAHHTQWSILILAAGRYSSSSYISLPPLQVMGIVATPQRATGSLTPEKYRTASRPASAARAVHQPRYLCLLFIIVITSAARWRGRRRHVQWRSKILGGPCAHLHWWAPNWNKKNRRMPKWT